MLNWILGSVAALLWFGAYGWYHAHDIGAAWTRWRERRLVRRQSD